MTVLPLVVAAIGGGVLAWAARDAGRAGTVIGVLALGLVAVLTAMMPDGPAPATLADEPVALHAYGRLFIVLASICGILLALLSVALPYGLGEPDTPTGNRDASPAPSFLVFLGAAVLALGIVSPLTALLPAVAGGLGGFLAVGRLAAESRPKGGRVDEAPAETEARVSGRGLGMELVRAAISLAAAVTALELLVGLADIVAGEPFGVGAAFLALVAAVGLRLGVVPFHAHAVRLIQRSARTAVPVLGVWGPTLFALAALAGLEAAVIPLGLPLSLERGVIAGLAVLTIIVGGLVALVQDDLDHLIAYSIMQDAGFVLLAFAGADPTIWGPARAWLLVLPIAKSALLGWSLATGRTFGTRSLLELRGWVRRAPLLAIALVALSVGAIGLPGFASFDARLALLRGALGEPIRSLLFLASLTSVAIVGRLLVIGLGHPTEFVRGAPAERLRRPRPDLRRRVGATGRLAIDLNRVPLAALLVLMLSLVVVSVGAGMFGLRGAAAADIPAAQPGPEPTTGPGPSLQPIPTARPSIPVAPTAS